MSQKDGACVPLGTSSGNIWLECTAHVRSSGEGALGRGEAGGPSKE